MSAQKKTTEPEGDLGASEVQAKFDEANAKGYWGESPDKTPRENYTLRGVASGKPTPETQPPKRNGGAVER